MFILDKPSEETVFHEDVSLEILEIRRKPKYTNTICSAKIGLVKLPLFWDRQTTPSWARQTRHLLFSLTSCRQFVLHCFVLPFPVHSLLLECGLLCPCNVLVPILVCYIGEWVELSCVLTKIREVKT